MDREKKPHSTIYSKFPRAGKIYYFFMQLMMTWYSTILCSFVTVSPYLTHGSDFLWNAILEHATN